MKKITFLLVGLLAVSLSFGAAKKSINPTQTAIPQTNAYTALKWDFGTTGRNYVDGDVLTFVKDSANSVFVTLRDIGPMARNQQSVNYFQPDSLFFCLETARVDADTGSTILTFTASVNGGTYIAYPGVASNDVGVVPTRTLSCYGRRFIPGLSIKPIVTFGGSTDTAKIYSALLFTR
jgi:hypothetical protein